jgi:superkiller protein 3
VMKIKSFFVAAIMLFAMANVSSQVNEPVNQENYKSYLELSRQYYKEYRYQQALVLLEKLYSFDSTNTQVTNQLAELYSSFNNKRKAIYFLSKTLMQDSLNLYALIASGDIYLRNADPGLAQGFYFRVINYADSNNYYAYRQIANSFHGMGEDFYPLALDYYKKAVQFNPYDVFSYSRMGNIYNVTNRYRLADSISTAGLMSDSTNSTLINIKAYAQYNMKLYLEAVSNFEKVFQKGDTITFSLKYTGLSYFNMNDFDKAQHFLERCVVYDSTDYDPFIILGQIYLQKNEFEKGLHCLRRAEQVNYPPPQKWSEMFKLMADIYNQQNKWTEAIECFQQAYKLNPDDKTLLCKLAYQYDYMNQRDKAISLYTKVIETADPEVYVGELKLAKDRLQKLKLQKSLRN